ncbi:ribosomal protein S6 kinase alpha-3-like [Tamandua tetradactyla]|uniref:ribosomal protein S6 kinase alpha-3-like n=1 Tax=Tamandua tetradactyla TaxID=48850 RepID=UPI004054495E
MTSKAEPWELTSGARKSQARRVDPPMPVERVSLPWKQRDEGAIKEIPITHHVKEGYEKADPAQFELLKVLGQGSWKGFSCQEENWS